MQVNLTESEIAQLKSLKCIVFTGYSKVGKDTTLDKLSNVFHISRVAFADELRVVCNKIFPWCPKDALPSKDSPLLSHNNPNNLTQRDIWKILGAEDTLRHIQPNIFVDMTVHNQLLPLSTKCDTDQLVIISDLRTDEAYEFVKWMGWPIIKIVSPDRLEPLDEYDWMTDEYIPALTYTNNKDDSFPAQIAVFIIDTWGI